MKNKYQRMTKEEKKNLRVKYFKTPKGIAMKIRFIRLRIYGILGLILSIALIVMAIRDNSKVYEYIIPVTLIITSFVFIISTFVIAGKEFNKYAINQK